MPLSLSNLQTHHHQCPHQNQQTATRNKICKRCYNCENRPHKNIFGSLVYSKFFLSPSAILLLCYYHMLIQLFAFLTCKSSLFGDQSQSKLNLLWIVYVLKWIVFVLLCYQITNIFTKLRLQVILVTLNR